MKCNINYLNRHLNYIELLAYPAVMTKYILIELVTIRPNQIID